MAGNALESFQMSLRFDQYHTRDRHDGREIEKFPRYDPPPPKDDNYLKMAPHKLPISEKWPPPPPPAKLPAPLHR